MELNFQSKVKLNNGIEMPILGLGTWALTGKSAYQAVIWALEVGYRLIDTATLYGNEREIGKALKDTDIPRDEIFITTKVWQTDLGYEKTLSALETSLRKLDLSYIDLYLIHWPTTELRHKSWEALEKSLKDERTRSIGVSNYNIQHLAELFDRSDVLPSVNQVEFSPFLYKKELLKFCQSNDIFLEAYSPLTRGKKLDHPKLIEVAKKYNKTSAQILIRWGLQHRIIEIPRSGNQNHLIENADVFDFKIDTIDMKILNNLNEDYSVVNL
jgi:diketogulonate reductase-like aldo/keto reductase